MSKFSLRMISAKHGDSLMLFANGVTVLIDGGPSGVYQQSLRDQLLLLERTCDDPPQIDLMMVSHIDADHIDGILDLTRELKQAQAEEGEPIVRIKEVWHNSFDDLIASTEAGVESSEGVHAATTGITNALSDEAFGPWESMLVPKSVGQGRQLRLDLETLKIELNSRFPGKIVLQGDTEPWVCGDLSIHIIGPTQAELAKLRQLWKKKLKDILDKPALTPLETVRETAATFDQSVSNLASIVAIAKVGDKSILLTGDARGDMILKWLEETGYLAPEKRLHFDVIKLPHHGSDRNVTPEFFERVTADHYLISGDGKHGNPEPKTFEMLFTSRPALDYKIYLSHDLQTLKSHRDYIKAGNARLLEEVFSDPARRATIHSPGVKQKYIDVALQAVISDGLQKAD